MQFVSLCVCYACGFTQHLHAKNIAYHEINALAKSYTFMKLTAENKVYMLTTLKYNVNDIYFLSQLRRTIDFGLK